MFQKINITLADKIEASKNSASDPNISTNSAPSTVDGSPGNSNVQQPDTSGINSAGDKVSQQQSEAQKGTNPESRKAALPGDIQYEKQGDAEFPTEQDPQKVKPTPKKKGFMESLIEAKATSYMESQMKTPEAQNGTKGKEVDQPTIAKQPDNKRVDKPQTNSWSPNNMGDNRDKGLPNQEPMNTIIDKRKDNPTYSNNKTYTPINYKAPKINFKAPKFK